MSLSEKLSKVEVYFVDDKYVIIVRKQNGMEEAFAVNKDKIFLGKGNHVNEFCKQIYSNQKVDRNVK